MNWNSNWNWIFVVCAVALSIYLIRLSTENNTRENLRMQGSFDLRGDVPIARYPVGPWNISSNSPKIRRTMTIGSDGGGEEDEWTL